MSMYLRGVMVILDGLGDRASPTLDYNTPLEAAPTPNMDRLVETGQCGQMDPLYPGVPVGTQTGTGILLGMASGDAGLLNRGPVEAAGVGLEMRPGDVALRCNFATVERLPGGTRVLDRRAGRIREHTDELCSMLQEVPLEDGVSATLAPATQHRAVLRLRGQGLSAAISDTDPGAGPGTHWLRPCRPHIPDDPEAIRSAAAINEFLHLAHERLSAHPVNEVRRQEGKPEANGIVTRGAGQMFGSRNLVHHLGLRAAVVAGERTVIGLGKLFNYSTVCEPRFTTLADTDLDAKVQACIESLEEHDLVFLHIKGTDICSHDHQPEAKRDFLARIDAALAPLMDQGLVLAVTGDHSTDSNTGRHSGDPVPSLLTAPTSRRDGCSQFGERHCMSGGLGRISGSAFLSSMLDNMGWLGNYRPGDRMFFRTD